MYVLSCMRSKNNFDLKSCVKFSAAIRRAARNRLAGCYETRRGWEKIKKIQNKLKNYHFKMKNEVKSK